MSINSLQTSALAFQNECLLATVVTFFLLSFVLMNRETKIEGKYPLGRHLSPSDMTRHSFFPSMLQIYDTNIEASGGIKAAFVRVSECITSLDNPHDLCRRTSPQLYSVPLRISVDQLGVILDLRELEFMFAAESHLKCFPLSQVFCASRAPPGVSTGIQPGAPA